MSRYSIPSRSGSARSSSSRQLQQHRQLAERRLAAKLVLGAVARGSVAELEPGYNQDEVFDDQFERRAHEIQRTPGSSGAVAVISPKTGPWSGDNQLGIERAFTPDENNHQTILRLDEWGFPEVWSVMLGMRFTDDAWGPSAGALFAVTAQVEAGSGGAVQSFEVDWVQGSTFSCNMNALNLVASYSASVDTPDDLRLIATISKGKIAGRPPTRSLQLGSITTGGVTTNGSIFRIPDFARSVTVIDASATAAATNYQAGVVLEFLGNPTGTTIVGAVQGGQLSSFAANGVPIPLFARYVRMRVDSAIAVVSTNLVFHLAL